MAGRKRKEGRRHKSGKLVQTDGREREDDVKVVARTGRLKEALRRMDNPHFGSSLGRAHLLGIINDRQREAGILFEKTVRTYAAIMGIPLNPQVTARLEKLPGKSLNAEPGGKKVVKVRKDYDEMFACLLSQGHRAAREASRVCVHDEPVSDAYALRTALESLVHLLSIQPDTPHKSPAAIRIRKYSADGYRPTDRPELRETKSG